MQNRCELPFMRGLSDITLAVVCLFVASKLDEIDDRIPFFSDLRKEVVRSPTLAAIGKPDITKKELVKLEKHIVEYYNWDINEITVFDFVENYLTLGVMFQSDTLQASFKRMNVKTQQPDNTVKVGRTDAKNLNKLVRTLCRSCLLEFDTQQYPASLVAASCIRLA